MILVTIKGETYNLDQMVKYITHVGQREIGATESLINPVPVFGEFRFLELVFADGSHVELDGIQSEALLAFLETRSHQIDLDQIDEKVLGHVVVHNSEVGDLVLAEEEETPIGEALIQEGDPGD